jgi:hypothetical protein
VIEFEFFQAADGYEVSLRFALCHPSSVDRVFVEVALSLMSEFYLTATICEELPKDEPREYTSRDRDRFITNCCWSIARSRLLWRQMFGMEEAGLSVSDALRRYFMNNRADSV